MIRYPNGELTNRIIHTTDVYNEDTDSYIVTSSLMNILIFLNPCNHLV